MQKRRTSHPAYVALATGATEQLEARRLRLDLLTELPSVNYCVAGQRMTYAAEAAGRIKEANDAHRDPITVDIEAQPQRSWTLQRSPARAAARPSSDPSRARFVGLPAPTNPLT